MIDGIDFSGLGEEPTPFEVRLLQQAGADGAAWAMVGQRLIQELGVAAGVRALALILDEMSCPEVGMKVWVPTRRDFFAALWREQRDSLVRDLAGRGGWTNRDIADALGLTPRLVRKIAKGCHRSGPEGRGRRGITRA